MTNLDEQIRRGAAADRLIGDAMFQEAISATRALYINTMIDAGDDETLKQSHIRLKLVNTVVGHITEMLEDGKRAKEELERLRNQK